MLSDLLVGFGISGFFLFAGLASWYHPTLFVYLFDHHDLDPWPQLLFTPAAYVGGLFLVLTLDVNLYFVQAVVCLGVGAAVLLRHDRNPGDDDHIWPSRAVAAATLGVGGVFAILGVAASVGLVEPL